MNPQQKVLTTNLRLTELSEKYLNYLLLNKDQFDNADNWSLIQYLQINTLTIHSQISVDVYNNIARMSRNYTFLNIGTGPGFLERLVETHQKVNLESVEWEKQYECFSPIREHLDIKEPFMCTSIYDDFNIYDCDKKWDYGIAVRFFPLNKKFNNTIEELKTKLFKISKYCNKLIIFDDLSNYNDEMIEYFNKIGTVTEKSIVLNLISES